MMQKIKTNTRVEIQTTKIWCYWSGGSRLCNFGV